MRPITALVLLCVLALSACAGGLTPAQQASYDRVKCEVKALAPIVESDADAVVRAIEDGKLTLDDATDLANKAEPTVKDAKAAFAACRAASK